MYFAPKYDFGNHEILHGRLPLWNPFEFAGYPFLATAQPAALYLPKILVYAIWKGAVALGAFFILHLLLGTAFFLAFIREQRVGLLGGLAGVLFWSFNVTFLTATGYPLFLASTIWVPLMFLVGERIGKASDLPALAALAMFVAVQITAGYPIIPMNVGMMLAVHAVVRYATGGSTRPPWKTVPLLAAGFLLGAIAAGAQSLPLIELASTVEREALATGAVAALQPLFTSLSAYYKHPPPDVLGMLGLIALVCASLSRRNAAPWTGAIICLWMTFGGFALLRVLPGFSAARISTPWAFLLQFYLAWLVAKGAERISSAGEGDGIGPTGRRLVAAVAFTWAFAYLAAALQPHPRRGAGTRSAPRALHIFA